MSNNRNRSKQASVRTYNGLVDMGVSVKVITGDSLPVAQYVGNVLHHDGAAVCCAMDDHVPGADEIERFSVYAKCKPDQKSLLIDEHLDHGIVGFLGEGINDALALKRADVGFVVSNASDIARQSGDVILLERSLSPIITAVTASREAFLKIRTYLLCTLTGNIGTLFSLTAVVIFWQQVPMLPIQILLNNILTDMPLMFLITDTVSKKLLDKPVRNQVREFFTTIALFALVSSVFDMIFFFAFKSYDIAVLRTGWFVFSVLAELTLIFSLRSQLPIIRSPRLSRPLGVVLVTAYIIAIALPFLGPVAGVFSLVPLSLSQLGTLIGITGIYLIANEIVKYARLHSR